MSQNTDSNDSQVSIGWVRKPIGLKGWCAVTAHGSSLELLTLPFEVTLDNGRGKVVRATFLNMEKNPKGFRCLFEKYRDREQAELLRDCQVLISQNDLPQLDEDEFFHFELLGMDVFLNDGDSEIFGTVVDVHNYPSVDALDIKKNDGHTVLIPMRPDVVMEINREDKSIILSSDSLEDFLSVGN